MKLYISTDFEGVSGIVAWEQIVAPSAELELGRALLLGETNAAIEGALSAGVTEVTVNDSHSVMRNLDLSLLAGRASYISGRHKPLYMMQGLDASFDAAFFLGYHGAAGDAAVLSHTYNPRAIFEVRLNGEVTGEAGINALVAQAYGVPVVLVSGDAQTAQETQRFIPQARAVQVKRSVSRFGAENLHPETAREMIRSAAADSIASARSADRAPITLPAVLDVTFLVEDMAELAAHVRGVERTGPRTARLQDDDTLRLYTRFVAVVMLTRVLVDA